MFSGIVEERAVLEEINLTEQRLRVRSGLNHSYSKIGDSICINGACLTVVKIENNILDFEISAETLKRTNLGELSQGSPVNLERSLIVGERIHGHFVFGHVDGVTRLLSVDERPGSLEMKFGLPPRLQKYVVEKGSISVNGVSLTISAVQDDNFTVSIIPHTLQVTVLGEIKMGDNVNLEVDMLARYVLDKAV
jgi:riboflavin synthase